jgi:uncharacterized membrane protein
MPSETKYFTGGQLSHAVTTILRSPAELHAACKDVANIQRVLAEKLRVSKPDDAGNFWKLEGAGDKAWTMEIVSDVPGAELALRSRPESPVQIAVSITFNQTENDRGTQVRVTIEYLAAENELARLMHKVLGDATESHVRATLHRFRQLMETGEVAVAKGQPVGTNSSRSDRPGEKDDPRTKQAPAVIVNSASQNPAALS